MVSSFNILVITMASSLALARAAAPSDSNYVTVDVTKRPASGGINIKKLTALEAVRRLSFASSIVSNLHANGTADAPSVNKDITYTANTTVDSQFFQLIVDTGSSNTWVGASRLYVRENATMTDKGTEVSYGSGSFAGTEFQGAVELGGLTAQNQYFGAAAVSKGFSGYDGIIGFGPVGLTQGTVIGLATVPTFLDTLLAQNTITCEVFGVAFRPLPGSATAEQNGILTLGGVDPSLYNNPITYTPRTTTTPYSEYWGIDVDGVQYGNTSLASGLAAIVDTGTTLIYIPGDAYNAFLQASGGTTDSSSGLASYTTMPTENFTLLVANTPFPLTPSQYLIPEAQYSYYGLTSGKYYSWINTGGVGNVDFIIGQKFMEDYYAIFDTTNNQVGFAAQKS